MFFQLKCAILDIKKNWIRMLFILIQFSISMVLLCYIIQCVTEFNLFQRQMDYLTENRSMYMFNDDTEEYRFNQMINQEDLASRIEKLCDFIDNELGLVRYVADTSCTINFDKIVPIPSKSIKSYSSTQNYVYTLKINDEFISTFNLKGNLDSAQNSFVEYQESDKEIPVILGGSFEKYYSIGDVLYDCRQKSYRICGFLNRGSYYIAPNRIQSIQYLDNYIIMPSCISENTDSLTAAFEFLSSYYIIDDSSQMYQIIEKADQLELFSLKLLSFKDQCKVIQDENIERILFNSALLVLLFGFALIGFMGNLIQMISDSSREFSIHLLCGAKESQIILRVGIQIFLINIISNIASFLAFGICKSFIIALCCSLILNFIILLYPIAKINSQSIIKIIRRTVE